ncbi:MAG: hypothetical protein DMG06_25015 [Acidobacteria bacterium]|nr:MAG: hypothetical protein DMG06_25015 [Acidobacteriota bacterium]
MSEFPWENLFSVIEPQINAAGTHMWPFDSSFPLDVRFFTLGGPKEIRMNRHDYFEVREGDLVVVGSTLYHRIISCPRLKMKAVVLYFQPEVIRAAEANGEDVEYLMPFLLQDSDFPHVVPPTTGIPAEVFALMQRIRAVLPASSNRSRLTVRTYMKMILILLINHYAAYSDTREIFNRRQEAFQRLHPLFDFIENHYDQPITIQDAAGLCAMSLSYFMRFFKQVTGQSFHDYLNHFRVAKAQLLLTSTERSISEISQEVGFCDQSYFGTVFRKMVNSTPGVYRRSFGKSSQGASESEEKAPACREEEFNHFSGETSAHVFQNDWDKSLIISKESYASRGSVTNKNTLK